MKLSITAAKLFLQLLNGEKLSGIALKQTAIGKALQDGVVQQIRNGKNRYILYLTDKQLFEKYISNLYGIENVEIYLQELYNVATRKSTLVKVASSSKLKKVRSFKGFLVNTFSPVHTILNQQPFVVEPLNGSFIFISDFENFIIDENVVIVGVENAENFKYIHQQAYLFNNQHVLFVARYPQTQHADLLNWLKSIPNKYLHFGDFDFEGIRIYLHMYKKHLKERGSFFIPSNLAELMQANGNRNLYNNQLSTAPKEQEMPEVVLQHLIHLLHTYKKGLEQEVLIKNE
ncbi:MAG: hypothetical protein KBD28_02490 [Chitinophagaceae bacterium]|nr:hypothetical protein [Chitinophagaceae bacterium]